jgi:hypothetical protein
MVDEDENCPDHDSSDCDCIDDQKHWYFPQELTPYEKGRRALRTAACPGKLPVSAMIILPAPVEIEAASRILRSGV